MNSCGKAGHEAHQYFNGDGTYQGCQRCEKLHDEYMEDLAAEAGL